MSLDHTWLAFALRLVALLGALAHLLLAGCEFWLYLARH